jgi:hypothetical protein
MCSYGPSAVFLISPEHGEVRNDAAGMGVLEGPASEFLRSDIATAHSSIVLRVAFMELSQHFRFMKGGWFIYIRMISIGSKGQSEMRG